MRALLSDPSVKWLYVLDADYAVCVRRHLPRDSATGAFVDTHGVRRLELHADGTVKVLAGYAWDGCTPKMSMWDIVFGISDGVPHRHTFKPKAYYASLVHDALYQFLGRGLPLTRRDADRIFLELLERDGFAARRLYYLAVRIFGRVTLEILRRTRDYSGNRVPL